MVKLSLCVPVLNEGNHLPRLFNQLSRQTDKDFEVIFVDGGSKDNTVKIIQRYMGALNIKLFFEEGDVRSTGNARNIAINKASGEYVFVMAADAIFDEHLIERFNLLIDTFNEFDVISVRRTYGVPQLENFVEKILFYRDVVVCEGVRSLIRKSIHPGYDPECSYGEDRLSDEKLAKKDVSRVYVGGDFNVVFYDYGITSLKSFVKRYLWYGRSSFEYFNKTSKLTEKLTVLLGWLSLPLFPVGALLGLVKAIYRARFFRCYKSKNLMLYLGVLFLEFLSIYLFSFGAISRLWNRRRSRD